jgi:hypothetical protein
MTKNSSVFVALQKKTPSHRKGFSFEAGIKAFVQKESISR